MYAYLVGKGVLYLDAEQVQQKLFPCSFPANTPQLCARGFQSTQALYVQEARYGRQRLVW